MVNNSSVSNEDGRNLNTYKYFGVFVEHFLNWDHTFKLNQWSVNQEILLHVAKHPFIRNLHMAGLKCQVMMKKQDWNTLSRLCSSFIVVNNLDNVF